MDRFLVKGRQIEVVFAQERRKTPNEMRGRVVDGRGRPQRDRGRDKSNRDGRGNGEKKEDPLPADAFRY